MSNVTTLIGAFSFEIAKRVLEEGHFANNFIASTATIYLSMLMIHIGTSGRSSSELTKLLGYDFSKLLPAQVAADSSSLKIIDELSRLFMTISVSSETNGRIFSSCDLSEAYAHLLKGIFSVDVEFESFTDPEAACQNINSWVNEKTYGQIPQIVNPSQISDLTVFVLATTIYFKSTWETEFSPLDTFDENFKINEKEIISVPMMHQTEKAGFYSDPSEKYSLLYKNFKGGNLIGVFILPDPSSSLEELLNNLSFSDVITGITNAEVVEVRTSIPKFDLRSKMELKETFKALGVHDIFESSCDLSKVCPGQISVSSLLHSATIQIDEEGVVAAASSAIAVSLLSALPGPEFDANRPFLFAIMEKPSNTILFLNAIVNPYQE